MSNFEFLSEKKINDIQSKYNKRYHYLLIFVVPAFFACCYFSYQSYFGNDIPFYSKPLAVMFFVALIASFSIENTLSNHQYCDVDDAKEIIKLANKYEEVTRFLVNINALSRKPTHAEYKEILSIGEKCKELLIAQESKDQKVFDELASLGKLVGLPNLNEK